VTEVLGNVQVQIHLQKYINPLNAELILIYHLLILLGDLTFMGPCIVSIFQYIYPTRCSVRLRSHCIRIWPIFYTGVHCRHRKKKQMRLNKWKRSQWCHAALTCTSFRHL
jgi:hypothetical protein